MVVLIRTGSTYLESFPDADGWFGEFGGNHYPDELRPALAELDEAYRALRDDPEFRRELDEARTGLQGRPTPVHRLRNTSADAGGAALFAKREDLNHTGGSAIGPHPFPMIVRDFQAVVGQEAREQFLALTGGALPDHVVACAAGGSNAMGIYSGFLDDPGVALHAVEPLGRGSRPGQHGATLAFGRAGTLHGTRSIVLQDDDDLPTGVSSVASGLVYPGIGPELAMLHASGRVSVGAVSDDEAVATFHSFARREGIIPALESAHALAYAVRLAGRRPAGERILVNLSGRGDKDVDFVLAGQGSPTTA